ncbi:hypothetical protein F5883DRAFT_106607 [Diaporthe sp. PMI_573]|nr:hypothetical protein F5883DRAFT_106607 [Diaporthaceae sp. PMI_573]
MDPSSHHTQGGSWPQRFYQAALALFVMLPVLYIFSSLDRDGFLGNGTFRRIVLIFWFLAAGVRFDLPYLTQRKAKIVTAFTICLVVLGRVLNAIADQEGILMVSITTSVLCPGIGEDLFRAARRAARWLCQWSGNDGSFA